MEEKGASKALWVIAIVLVIFLIGGIVVLYGIGQGVEEATQPSKLSSVTTEAMDHEGTTSMKVVLEGEKDSYSLTMSGPEKNTVGTAYVTSSDMADGRETAWVSMADYQTQAKAGTYTLIIEDTAGNKVYENTFTFSGPNLTVESWGSPEFSHMKYVGYYLENLSVTVSNDGDLPVYVTDLKVTVGGEGGRTMIGGKNGVITPGGTKTLKGEFYLGSFEEGSYSATYKLLETHLNKPDVTLATHSTTIQIP